MRQLLPNDVFADVEVGWGSVAIGAGGTGHADDGNFTSTSSNGPFDHPFVPGLRIAKRATSANGTVVDYYDGVLWMLPLNGQVRKPQNFGLCAISTA